MIVETADFRIQPGQQGAFEEAIQQGLKTVLARAEGFRGWRVVHGIESPDRYLLTIYWDTLEAHTVGFRGGPLFPAWRAIIGPFFAQPPQVEHYVPVGESDADGAAR